MPRYLGQHFLKNDAVIKKIVAAIDPQPGDVILEVGPGHGELTFPLAAAAQKFGAKIIAVERDAKLAAVLRGKVEIVEGDILAFLESQPKFSKIVGNIPYYLTGHLLRMIGEGVVRQEKNIGTTRAVLMMQKEVAERACAVPPDMNRLAASVQYWAEPKLIARIPRGDFSPPPEVDSAVLQLNVRVDVSEASGKGSTGKSDSYYRAMRALFAQPRKTILNNLAAAAQNNGENFRETLTEALAALKIDPKLRPQDLSIKNIQQIAAWLSSVHK